jgi:Nitronate monooxygenase
MVKTKLCRALGIEVPILSAPFGGGGAGPELASAVSNAGGLGLLGMGGMPAPLIREQIRDTRARTSKPFGVGLLLPFVAGGEVETCVEERVPVLMLFWGDARPHVDKAKRGPHPRPRPGRFRRRGEGCRGRERRDRAGLRGGRASPRYDLPRGPSPGGRGSGEAAPRDRRGRHRERARARRGGSRSVRKP